LKVQRHRISHCTCLQKTPSALQKSWNASSSGTVFCFSAVATVHRGPAFPTVPHRRRALAPQNIRFCTTTCYPVGGTGSPVFPNCTEAQHFSSHLPSGESHLSCLRAGIAAPPLRSNLLLCRNQKACIPCCKMAQGSPL
jgi:hypothetical protein